MISSSYHFEIKKRPIMKSSKRFAVHATSSKDMAVQLQVHKVANHSPEADELPLLEVGVGVGGTYYKDAVYLSFIFCLVVFIALFK